MLEPKLNKYIGCYDRCCRFECEKFNWTWIFELELTLISQNLCWKSAHLSLKNYKKEKDLRNLLNVTKPVGGRTETTKYRAPKLSVRLGHAFTSGKDTKEQILWCAYNPRQIWSLSRNLPCPFWNSFLQLIPQRIDCSLWDWFLPVFPGAWEISAYIKSQ